MAGMYSGESKASPARSPVLTTAPILRSIRPMTKSVLLAWSSPPELTTIWVKLLSREPLALVALKVVVLALSSPPEPTTICDPS